MQRALRALIVLTATAACSGAGESSTGTSGSEASSSTGMSTSTASGAGGGAATSGTSSASSGGAGGSGGCTPTVPAIPGTRVTAATQGWWGNGDHWSGVTYSDHDPSVVATQEARMAALGIGGLSINWYGVGSWEDETLLLHLAEAKNHGDFKVYAMWDGGALLSLCDPAANATPKDFTDLAIAQFQYLYDLAMQHADTYLMWDGQRPLIQAFMKSGACLTDGGEGTTDYVDWKAVIDALPGPVELQSDDPSAPMPPFTGAFAWVGPDTTTPSADSPPRELWVGDGTARLDDFYATMESQNPGFSFTGAAWNWFDDTRAPWGEDCTLGDGTVVRCRVIRPNGGATWCGTWQHTLGHPTQVVHIPTWDDYEEGTAIENGIDFNGTLPTPWQP